MGGAGEDPLWLVVAALEAHGSRGRGANWQCPAHDDRNPSLSVARGRNGNVVLTCHAGCEREAIIAALGLRWQDLFAPENRRESAPPRPSLDQLLRLHRDGRIAPRVVRFGEPRAELSNDAKRVLEDMRLLMGLFLAVGEERPMPYSCRFAASRQGWPNGHVRANKAILELVAQGVVVRDQYLAPRGGYRNGVAVYLPPRLRAESRSIPVERHREPRLEVVDESVVDGAVQRL